MSLPISECTYSFIDGECVKAARGETFPVHNPATGEVLGTVPDCDEIEAIKAVEAAERASSTWAAMPPVEREDILLRAHDLILDHLEDLARIITLEEGKPLAEARAEVLSGAAFVRWYASEGRRQYGDIVTSSERGKRLFVFREPVGPVLVVTPWNDPLGLVMRKAAAALAAGCTIVAKPSQETPFSTIASALLFAKAGMPAGVVNVVTTARARTTVEVMLNHPAIKHITFTGSTDVGKSLGAQAGALVKRVTMELGGHAPFVVFDDADIRQAVADLLARKFRNAGQTCSCPSRLFLQETVADAFLEAFVDGMERIVVGDGLDPAVTMGPLISRTRRGKDAEFVATMVGRPDLELDVVFFKIPHTNTIVELVKYYNLPDQPKAAHPTDGIGGMHLAFFVEDLDAAIECLRQIGATVMTPVDITYGAYTGGRAVYFRGPDGVLLQFMAVTQRPGKLPVLRPSMPDRPR